MPLQAEYKIDDQTWQKVKKVYIIGILLGTPFLMGVFSFCTWPIITDLSWAKLILFPGFVLILSACIFMRYFFVRSKYTLFLLFLNIFQFEIYFAVISSACAFSLFGSKGVIIQNAIFLAVGLVICLHYYSYWKLVWDSNKKINESKILDLQNARFDLLNGFNIDENKIRKTRQKRLSQPTIVNIICISVSIGVITSHIFRGDSNLQILIIWVLSIPFILGWLKPTMAAFNNFRKLAYYEKKIGKPIINGLLEK